MDAESVARQLYRGAPSDFVAARKAAANQAKARGETTLGKTISAMRKPSAAAWAINRLADREHGDGLADVPQLHVEFAAAQASGDGRALRDLDVRRRELVSEATRDARTIADDAGVALSAAALTELEQTLRAGVADRAAAAAVTSGVLVRGLSANGYDPVDIDDAVGVPIAVPDAPTDGVSSRASAGGATQRRPTAGDATASSPTAGDATASSPTAGDATASRPSADRARADRARSGRAPADRLSAGRVARSAYRDPGARRGSGTTPTTPSQSERRAADRALRQAERAVLDAEQAADDAEAERDEAAATTDALQRRLDDLRAEGDRLVERLAQIRDDTVDAKRGLSAAVRSRSEAERAVRRAAHTLEAAQAERRRLR